MFQEKTGKEVNLLYAASTESLASSRDCVHKKVGGTLEAQTADWGIWHGSRAIDRLDSIKKTLLNCGITVVQALSTSICLESNSHCMTHYLTDQN